MLRLTHADLSCYSGAEVAPGWNFSRRRDFNEDLLSSVWAQLLLLLPCPGSGAKAEDDFQVGFISAVKDAGVDCAREQSVLLRMLLEDKVKGNKGSSPRTPCRLWTGQNKTGRD